MAIPEYYYKSLEHLRETRDEVKRELANALETNMPTHARRSLENKLEMIRDRIAVTERYLARRTRDLAIPEYHYKSLEHLREAKDKVGREISKATETNMPTHARRSLEDKLEMIRDRIEVTERYIAHRKRDIDLGTSI